MKFELGKTYKHSTCREMKIIGSGVSQIYGLTLIAETPELELKYVGLQDENTLNWKEVTNEK